MDFDAIVIGSGFGGAVSACRLAEAGYRVLVLERGRRWDAKTYPRKDHDPWWWSNAGSRALERLARPARLPAHGGRPGRRRRRRLADLRQHLMRSADEVVFDRGWPAEITFAELKRPTTTPSAKFMNVQRGAGQPVDRSACGS